MAIIIATIAFLAGMVLGHVLTAQKFANVADIFLRLEHELNAKIGQQNAKIEKEIKILHEYLKVRKIKEESKEYLISSDMN